MWAASIFDELHFLGDPGARPCLGRGDHPLARARHLRRPLGDGQQRRRAAPLDRARHGPMALVFHAERAVPLEHYYFFESSCGSSQDAEGCASSASLTSAARPSCARMLQSRAALLLRRRRDEPANDHTSPAEARWPSTTGSARAAKIQRACRPRTEEPQERPAPEPGEILTALRAADLLPCLYFLRDARPSRRRPSARRDTCLSRRSNARG